MSGRPYIVASRRKKKVMSSSHKQKEIIEIFYDRDGLEIRPEDPEYERFLNGSEDYFGSYFVDENENIVREDNPQRAEKQKKKDAIRGEQITKEKNKQKTWKITLTIMAIVVIALILFIISQKTADDINKPYIELNSSVSSEFCSSGSKNCSTVNAARVSIEVSVSVNSRYTRKYTTPTITNLSSGQRYSCREVKVDKYSCEVELIEGSNNLKVISTVTPQDSTMSWEHSESLTITYKPNTSAVVNIERVLL